jgi:hypothetical protein
MALQWMRNQASNRSIYVSKFAQDSNYTSAKSVRRRLVHVVCQYLDRHPDRPHFLAAGGREAYYGGGPDTAASRRQTPCDGTVEYPQLPQGPPAKRRKPDGPPDARLAPEERSRLLEKMALYRRRQRRRDLDAFRDRSARVTAGNVLVPADTPDGTAAGVAEMAQMAATGAIEAVQSDEGKMKTVRDWASKQLAAAKGLLVYEFDDCRRFGERGSHAVRFCEQYKGRNNALVKHDTLVSFQAPTLNGDKYRVEYTTDRFFANPIPVSDALSKVFVMDPAIRWNQDDKDTKVWTRDASTDVLDQDVRYRENQQYSARIFVKLYSATRGRLSTEQTMRLLQFLVGGGLGVGALSLSLAGTAGAEGVAAAAAFETLLPWPGVLALFSTAYALFTVSKD